MFLFNLCNKEKHLFLDLEIYMSMVDGEFNDAEKKLIDLHALEMRVDHNHYTPEKSIDEVRSQAKQLDDKTKRIFFFELVSTVMSDGVYTLDEQKLIENIAIMFGLGAKDINDVFDSVNTLRRGYEKANSFIEG